MEESRPIEEGTEEEEKTFSQRATEKLNTILEENSPTQEGRDFDSLSPSGKWHRKHAREGRGRPNKSGVQQEVSTLFGSVLVLIFVFSKLPESTHPETEEINAVSMRLSRILLRHVDISGRLTGDVLDAIGIFAIGSAWYARVSPTLKELAAQKEAARVAPPMPIDYPPDSPGGDGQASKLALEQTISQLDSSHGLA